MTIEEDKHVSVMTENASVFDAHTSESEVFQDKDARILSKDDSVRSKMEAMQKRIDELKEKVKFEGELLCSKDPVFNQQISYSKSLDSLSDVKSKDSLSEESKSLENKLQENEELSDKSLYFSASSYSMCSGNSTSSVSTYCSFTKFVNDCMKNQDHKERLSLLQLHSKQQISMNMMKSSLLEMERKCTEELELVERNLKHLNKLAEEFNVNNEQPVEYVNSCKVKPLDLNCSGDSASRMQMTQSWLPVAVGSITKLELDKEDAFVKYKLKDCSSE